MAKLLILFAHPALEKSRIHSRLIRRLRKLEGVTFRDLYEEYPDFNIDVEHEQKLLLEHDIIIWQHPFYWYSAPALLKQWLDLVLEHEWAYGTNGNMLAGKWVFNAISCGGSKAVYSRGGRNRFTIMEFLAPFDQTARLCKMIYLPAFVIDGTHRLQETDMEFFAMQYEELLLALVSNRLTANEWSQVSYLNELFPIPSSFQS